MMQNSPNTLSDLKLGKSEPGNMFLVYSDRPFKPNWYDPAKFVRGQEFFKRHALSVCVGYFIALFVGFIIEPLADAVLFTGYSDGPKKSRKRYLATMAHIYTWHTTDIFDPSSLGYRSLRLVRSYHDSTRRRMERYALNHCKGISAKITQYDTSLVQSGFVGPLCLYPDQFGVSCSDQDLDDYRYFWRVIGYVLGLEDRFNVCGGTLRETKIICKEVEQLIVAPSLKCPADYYLSLSDDFLTGMSVPSDSFLHRAAPLFSCVEKNTIQAFVYPFLGLPVPRLSIVEYFRLLCIKCNFWLMYNCSLYRYYLNSFLLSDLEPLKNMIFD